jgi:hypothetical protein
MLFFLAVILTVQVSTAQSIGIGTATPNVKAVVDINSTTKGLLIPSMTSTQRLAITSPPNGLLVYDTDKNGFFHFNGISWTAILNGDYWTRPNSNRKRISNFTDSVGIGLTSATEWLDVDGNIRSRNNLLADNNVTATGSVSGGSLVTTGNLTALGTGFVGGDLQTLGDLIINSSTATMQLKSSSVNTGYFQLSGNNVRMGTNSGNSTGNLIIRMNGTDRVFVDETGKVGVGVTSPTEKLDVAGNINFNGKITSTQTGNAPLTPLCWGMTNSILNGGIKRGTANTSVSRISIGHYRITCPGITETSVLLVTPYAGSVTFGWDYYAPDQIDVYVFSDHEYINQIFSFIIY